MRKTLLSALAVAVLLGGSCPALAQQANLQPLLTVSFSGYDDAMAKLAVVGQIAGQPDLPKGLEATITAATGGAGLAGLDKSKPWGVLVQTDGTTDFSVIGFLPVTNLDQLLQVVAPFAGQAEDAGNGTKRLSPPPGADMPPLFVKAQGGWAFLAQTPEALANPPADPVGTLGGLHQKYVIAMRVSAKNLPAAMRDEMKRNLEQGAAALNQPLPGEGQEEFQLRTGMSRRMIRQSLDVLDDLNEVIVGWTVDAQRKSSYLDVEVTAAEGSKTAALFNEELPGKTNFAGFDLPGAAVTLASASRLSDADVAEMKNTLSQLRAKALKELETQQLAEAERQVAAQLLGDLLDVLETSIENRLVDGGMALVLESGSATLVAGGTIGDGDKLESVLKRLAQLAIQEDPSLAQAIKLDAETHAGLRLHTLAVPVPDEDVSRLIGPTLHVAVGINNSTLYAALGSDAVGVLKQVVDKSAAEPGKAIPPFRLSVSLAPIVQFAAEAAEDPGQKMMVGMLAGLLQQAAGKDHITLTSTQIPDGARVRLEFEEGILKLIGGAVQMIGGMGGPPGGAMPPADSPF